jgi:hypothetical protein
MDLNITHLKYKPKLSRPATPEDLLTHNQLICEHCHGPAPPNTCPSCLRGFHLTCQPQCPDTGLCSQCQDSKNWSLRQQQAYHQAMEKWYIEWEPQWEEEHQLRMLGYGEVVDRTLTLLAQTPQPLTKSPKDAHLSNKARQGNSGPTYPSTLETQSETSATS